MTLRPVLRSVLVLVLVLVLVAVLVPRRASASPASPSDSRIESVVVFPDRARVTRVRTARCEDGAARAVFERLPGSLDARTLRGEVREAAEVIGIGSVEVNEREAADARVRGLAAEQERIETELKSKDARKTQIAAELEDVGAFGGLLSATLAEEIRNPKPNARAWAASLDAMRARRAALAEERRKLDTAVRGLKQALDKVKRELQPLAGARETTHITATVTIGCRGLPHVTATVSYVLPGAGWQPEYDFDVVPRTTAKAGSAAVRLTVGALIKQATGEDWTDARVMLSTARPKLDAEAPIPGPLAVYGSAQDRGKVMVSAHERRTQLSAGASQKSGGKSEPESAALDDKGNSFVLTLPHPITVIADGHPVWAPVDVVETQATIKLVAMPKVDEHVYQIAALTNPAAYPLLEGRARSYRNGSYMGDAHLSHQGVGAPFEISLGADEELQVTRSKLDDKDVGAGFFSSTKHIVRAFRTRVTNQAAGPETVELREQIPVSKIDDVRVELVGKATSGGYQLDAVRGFVTWSVTLVRGEWRNVDIGYAIHLPESWEISTSQ